MASHVSSNIDKCTPRYIRNDTRGEEIDEIIAMIASFVHTKQPTFLGLGVSSPGAAFGED